MNKDFTTIMSQKTDEALIKITTFDRDTYQQEAIQAAEEEIRKRGVDTTTFEALKTDIIVKMKERQEEDERKVSIVKRLIHLVVDTLAFYAVTLVLMSVLDLFYKAENDSTMALVEVMMIAFGFFGYYIFMELNFQKTIGKFITGTRVVTKDFETPVMMEIFIRTLCRLIPFDHISYLFTSNGFHDRLSGTMVVNDKAL